MAEALDHALDLIRPMAAKRGIALKADAPRGIYVLADRQRLSQILLNLLSNAVKYNREGGTAAMGASGTATTSGSPSPTRARAFRWKSSR